MENCTGAMKSNVVNLVSHDSKSNEIDCVLSWTFNTVVWEKFMVRNIREKKIRGKNFRLCRP